MTKKKVGIPDVSKPKKRTSKVKKPEIDLVTCERELRKYVKRDGGYCKGITGNDRKRAQELLKLLERKELVWDGNILPIPQKSRLV